MPSERIYLGLGSNRGNSRAILDAACASLASFVEGLGRSRVYLTTPREVTDQPDFLNLVVTGLTVLAPLELLEAVNAIEAAQGRDRTRERRKGERTLDIDILLYGNRVIESARLTVPHASMAKRRFVLVPLLELDPFLGNPATGMPLAGELVKLDAQGIYYADLSAYNFVDSTEGGGGDGRCRHGSRREEG